MQLLPALSRRLLSLQAAQALCARAGAGQVFELPCAIAQLQLLSRSSSAAGPAAPTGCSGFNTLTAWTSRTASWPTARPLHASASAAVSGRGLDFIVASGADTSLTTPGLLRQHGVPGLSGPRASLDLQDFAGQGRVSSAGTGGSSRQSSQEQAAQPELRQQLLETALHHVVNLVAAV